MKRTLRERLLALDPAILGLGLALLVLGLAVLMSATGPVAFQRTGDSLYFVKHQLVQGIVPGLAAFLFFAIIDYRILKKFAFPILAGCIGLLLLVYVPGIGLRVGGSLSWLHVGPLRFQPSEIVKLGIIIYLAAWFSERRSDQIRDLQQGLIPFIGVMAVIFLLLIMQPDTGSMVVIVGTAGLIYLAAGAPVNWFLLLGAAGVALIALIIKLSPYRAARFMTFLHPELDPQGIGYHINQAILAVGSGGVMGMGYGLSRQKYLYLPEVEADSIFAIMSEEFGFILMLAVLALYGAFIWRCFTIARNSRDRFGSLIAAGVGSWIAIQTLMNIASMIGLMPITGVTLPFVSHGGTAMVVLLGGVGLVAGIPRFSGRE